MINCDHCNKSFKYPCFLEKHLSRKIPCFMKLPSENTEDYNKSKSTTNEAIVCLEVEDMVCIDEEKVCQKEEVCQDDKKNHECPHRASKSAHIKNGKCRPPEETDTTRKKNYACTTCDKTYYNRSALENHIPKCNGGIDTLQCPTCLKWFSHRNAKYAHMKNVKCKPPEPSPEPKEEPPRVIRKVTATVKLQIGASQSWKCNNCYDQLKSTFHIDHIIPICRGGTNVEDNLQALCVECHAQKTQKERQL